MWDILIELRELFSLLLGAIGETLIPFGQSVVLESWNVFYNTIIKRTFTITDSRFSYINVLPSLGIALTIYILWARRKGKAFSLRGAFQFIFPKHVWGHPFAWLDVRYFVVRALIVKITMVPIIVYTGAQTFLWAQDGFSTLIPDPPFPLGDLGFLSLFLIALPIMMIADFFFYVTHYLYHKVPFLWEFHKVHHSALVLNLFTAAREHLLETLAHMLVFTITFAVHGAFFATLIGYKPEIPTILGIGIFGLLTNLAGYNLRHSHIWFAYKPYWLGYIFNSPAHHQIHHSKETHHIDKNYAGIFTLWDWAFGTLHLPREREKFEIGLSDNSEQDYNTVWRLLWVPVAKAFKLVPQKLETPLKTQHPAQ